MKLIHRYGYLITLQKMYGQAIRKYLKSIINNLISQSHTEVEQAFSLEVNESHSRKYSSTNTSDIYIYKKRKRLDY